MEESKKVLEIEVPQGYEIDKKQSSFEKIVFKKVEEKLTYDDIAKKLFSDKIYYYIERQGNICKTINNNPSIHDIEPNHSPTKFQLERLLALNKLMNTAYYLNEGWEPDWNNGLQVKFSIYYNHTSKTIRTDYDICFNSGKVYFKSKELAEQAVEILGEETIKLALGVI